MDQLNLAFEVKFIDEVDFMVHANSLLGDSKWEDIARTRIEELSVPVAVC